MAAAAMCSNLKLDPSSSRVRCTCHSSSTLKPWEPIVYSQITQKGEKKPSVSPWLEKKCHAGKPPRCAAAAGSPPRRPPGCTCSSRASRRSPAERTETTVPEWETHTAPGDTSRWTAGSWPPRFFQFQNVPSSGSQEGRDTERHFRLALHI